MLEKDLLEGGFEQVPNWFIDGAAKIGLNQTDKLYLITLARHKKHKNINDRIIAQSMGVSIRTLKYRKRALKEKKLISRAKNGKASVKWYAIKSQIEKASAKPARQKMQKLHHCINHTVDHTRCFSKKNISASQKRCTNDRLLFVIQKTKDGKPKLLLKKRTLAQQTEELIELLGNWLDYDISTAPYEKPIFDMRTRLYERKIYPDAPATIEVLEYWIDLAKGLRLNGIKIPVHKIQNSRTIYMCQIIITGLISLRNYTTNDIKKAIDNYAWILENSPWYGKNTYSFSRFFANQQLFEDCLTDNVKGNNRYVQRKLSKEELLEIVLREHRIKKGSGPSYEEELFYKHCIIDRKITTEDEARRLPFY